MSNFIHSFYRSFFNSGTPTKTAPLYRARAGDIIAAKCAKSSEPFGIILERTGTALVADRGIRFTPDTAYAARQVLHTALLFEQGLKTSRTFHCPSCGNQHIVKCNRCGQLSCFSGTRRFFFCSHCNSICIITGTIRTAQAWRGKGESESLQTGSVHEQNFAYGKAEYHAFGQTRLEDAARMQYAYSAQGTAVNQSSRQQGGDSQQQGVQPYSSAQQYGKTVRKGKLW